ncbi:chitin-binding lectin 1-like [Solanum dulcamara]|uniref:chitin-binding lectin 1-like n=1 Tax=Solanum dulcamara TaxID=45834 RepID=UPI0024852411|nr:chitin-binding lectin 1-like [Solanum dulcamara]
MKEGTISLLALVALFLLKVVLADELSLPFHMPINETFDLEVFQGNALVGVYSHRRCGKGFGGQKCIEPGECCSLYGWCGTTIAYCAPENCQSQCVKPSPPPPPSAYLRCGRQAGGRKCIKPGECCSLCGWCGTTIAYCAPENCQSQCVKPSPPPPPSAYLRCGRQAGGRKCIKPGECCSLFGWCGTTIAYCAPENCQSQCVKPSPPPSAYPRCGRQGGGGKCIKTGECCSIYGWCGTTSNYCAPKNCQSQCKSTLTSSANNRMTGIESF